MYSNIEKIRPRSRLLFEQKRPVQRLLTIERNTITISGPTPMMKGQQLNNEMDVWIKE